MMTIEEAKDDDVVATMLVLACRPDLPLYLDYSWDVYNSHIKYPVQYKLKSKQPELTKVDHSKIL